MSIMGLNIKAQKNDDEQSKLAITISKPYTHYPVTALQVGQWDVFLEGAMYGEPLGQLPAVIIPFLLAEKLDLIAISNALSTISGEFWLVVKGNQELHAFTDRLGRLPVYYYNDDALFWIGRSLSHLQESIKFEPSNIGLQAFLWSGYPLGKDTLYKNVYRLSGGSTITYNEVSGKLSITEGNAYNFDREKLQPVATAAAQLKELFLAACKKITSTYAELPVNISLSGGQDSRAVAYGISAAHSNVFASSFVGHGGDRDAAIAQQIAAFCKIDWKPYSLHTNEKDKELLMQLKHGLNYQGMAFILDFYRQLLHQFPKGSLYITGDGGDKAFPFLGESNSRLSDNELVEKLIKRHAITPLSQVMLLTHGNTDEFKQHLWKHLQTYPETNASSKSTHFTVYERGRKCYFEGEDRTRYFFWATTPFYDLDFFEAAMQVPAKYKKGYQLYRHFQQQLSPGLAQMPDAGGFHIGSPLFTLKKTAQEQLRASPPFIKNFLRKLNQRGSSAGQATTTSLQLEAGQGLLEEPGLHQFISHANTEQLAHIKTVLALFSNR